MKENGFVIIITVISSVSAYYIFRKREKQRN